jgi:hypothetical protein
MKAKVKREINLMKLALNQLNKKKFQVLFTNKEYLLNVKSVIAD